MTEHEGEDAPRTFIDRLFPFVRMFLMWYAFNGMIGKLWTFERDASPPSSVDPVVEPPKTLMDTSNAEPFVNAFHIDDAISIRVYVTPQSTFSFAEMDGSMEQEQLRWYLPGDHDQVLYSLHSNHDDGVWKKSLNISIDSYILGNGTLYVHVFLTKQGYSPNPVDPLYVETASVHQVMPLMTYRPRQRIVKKRKLLETQVEQDTQEEEEEEEDSTYRVLWKPKVLINTVVDESVFSSTTRPPPFLHDHLVFDEDTQTYRPILYLNEFWILEDHLIPINQTITTLPLTFEYYPLPLFKFALYKQMTQQLNQQQGRDRDTLKRMLLETNPYLLTITIIVTLLHSLFDFLAFKNDVSFWKKQKSLQGISIRTLALSTFFQLVIVLYLVDNDTSYMVLISSFMSLGINIWKLKKAIVVRRNPETNRLEWIGDKTYTTETATYDRIAIDHLLFVVYPLVLGQAMYSLMYNQHKSWYSWILSSITSFVYAFGFIMMTPQLYINYKLKSVAHLPWRAMVYKSLNTFIDDLFAFVITMPWMHRLSCFRDDFIFFVYLYQRWIYPVDSTRTNEFGQGGEEELTEERVIQEEGTSSEYLMVKKRTV